MSLQGNEILTEARRLVLEGKIYELISVIVYHGMRSLDPEKIKRDGLVYTTDSYAWARVEISNAYKELGIRHKDHKFFIFESETVGGRYNIWVTIDKEAGCNWAKRSPEIVSYTVSPALVKEDISYNKFLKYKDERYGKPIVLELQLELSVRSLYSNPNNINTERRRIKSSEIISLSYCENRKKV